MFSSRDYTELEMVDVIYLSEIYLHRNGECGKVKKKTVGIWKSILEINIFLGEKKTAQSEHCCGRHYITVTM